MIYEVTQFGLPKNIAAGVTEALRQMQPGDTLHFPKGEYHFYKDYCQSLVVHTSNTDSFQRPKKTFGILLQDKKQLTLDGDGSVFVFHGNISALGVLRCRQITLRNFTIRYACPTNVELEVTAKQGHTVSYRVPENQPFYMDGGSVVFFNKVPLPRRITGKCATTRTAAAPCVTGGRRCSVRWTSRFLDCTALAVPGRAPLMCGPCGRRNIRSGRRSLSL